MRIAFHVPRASSLKPGESGDRVYVPALLTELEKRGHEVRVVSRVNARDVWRGRVSLGGLVREAIAVRREMKRFSPDAWFVFKPVVSSPDLLGWWLGPKRYVLVSADARIHRRSMPRVWGWLFSLAHRQSLKRADHVTAERPPLAAGLRAAGLPQERVSVLPLAVSRWERLPSREAARRRLELREETPVILCIARLSETKTPTVLQLLAAFSGLPPNLTLLVAGDGPGRERLEREARMLGLEHRVRFLGRCAHEDVPWLYAACDLYSYPSSTGDWSLLTVLEAQSCGRPVVVMDNSLTRLIVDNGKTGLLARDAEELQAHLAALASDRARCKSMGEAAREYIASHHSIEVHVEQIERLLGVVRAPAASGRALVAMSLQERVRRSPSVVPEDPGIPALAAMRERGVEAVLRDAGVGFAGGDLELAQHHPGVRCTFVARADGGRFVVKAYPDQTHPAAVAELLEGLRAGGLASGRGPTAPPLVAFHPPLSLLVTRWIEGSSARELVVRGQGSRAGELAAAWLQAVSKLELDAGRLFGPERAVKDAGKSAAAIAGADATLGRQAAAVVAAMDARWPRGGRVAVSNGSFRPKHLLDLVDGPGVIDWDGFRRGPLELDGGMFLAGLAQLVQERPEAAAAAAAAAGAFRRRIGGLVHEGALAWYEAGALLRLAKYDSDPASQRWRARATALVGRARALVDAT